MENGVKIQRFKNVLIQQGKLLVTQFLCCFSESAFVLQFGRIDERTWRTSNTEARLDYAMTATGRGITRSASKFTAFVDCETAKDFDLLSGW